MPVSRAEEAMRLSVGLLARVTLALEVTPSGYEGVCAYASFVSRLVRCMLGAYAFRHGHQ